MGVFKVQRCKSCGKRIETTKPKDNAPCPKCGTPMSTLDNWWISYHIHGKKRRKAISPKKQDAVVALAKVKVDIREKRFFDVAPTTSWHKAAEKFELWFKNNVAPNTQRQYRNCLKNLAPAFEIYTLDMITPSMVERFKADRSFTVKPATVNRDLATLKRLFSLAEQWGMVEVNRIRKVSLLPENNERVRFLTDKEKEALINACGSKHLRLAVQIALQTGLRKEGALTLRWSEIDFTRGIIEKSTKGGKVVRIPITDTLRGLLFAYKNESKVLSQYVMPSDKKRGKPFVDIKSGFHSALRGARIKDFTFHDLRHCFATDFLRRTKDISALKELLGHGDLKTTQRYAHVLDDHLREAMDTFDKTSTLRTNE